MINCTKAVVTPGYLVYSDRVYSSVFSIELLATMLHLIFLFFFPFCTLEAEGKGGVETGREGKGEQVKRTEE